MKEIKNFNKNIENIDKNIEYLYKIKIKILKHNIEKENYSIYNILKKDEKKRLLILPKDDNIDNSLSLKNQIDKLKIKKKNLLDKHKVNYNKLMQAIFGIPDTTDYINILTYDENNLDIDEDIKNQIRNLKEIDKSDTYIYLKIEKIVEIVLKLITKLKEKYEFLEVEYESQKRNLERIEKGDTYIKIVDKSIKKFKEKYDFFISGDFNLKSMKKVKNIKTKQEITQDNDNVLFHVIESFHLNNSLIYGFIEAKKFK